MTTLLRIDASIRLVDSNTRVLTNYFEEMWLKANPNGSVVRRCLTSDPVPYLTQEAFEAFGSVGGKASTGRLSDCLIAEIKHADHLLIGSPLYNFNLASSLKAYFDHVVRLGQTFEIENGHYRGLLGGKNATIITARGGYRSPDGSDDSQKEYLKQILTFMGISGVETVALEGTGEDQKRKAQGLAFARMKIDCLLEPSGTLTWLGEFTNEDKQEISTLRAGQAEAIIAGDASAYAALCTDDIRLLIPAKELISGRDAFQQAEETLFKHAKFTGFNKMPVQVERSGNLAVEVGYQHVQMHGEDHVGGVFSARQKYTHIFRCTDEGWRFAVLMSNSIE